MGQVDQQQKILILAAIPYGLRLDKEIRLIEECIKRAAKRDLFEIDVKTAARSHDIRRALAEERPTIVHFCGHGLEDGSLLLEDEEGNNKPVSPKGLALLFQLHANYVTCVLLNACYSAKTAQSISEYINYVIGMNQPIGDNAAIAFSQGFYDGLGYPTSANQDVFERAFEEGKVAIQLDLANAVATNREIVVKNEAVRVPDSLIPVLLKKQNPDPVTIPKPTGLTAGERRHLQIEYDELQEQFDSLSEEIQFLQQSERTDDLSPKERFRLKKQIEQAKDKRQQISNSINILENQLE